MPRGSEPGRSPLGPELLRLVASNEPLKYHDLVSRLAPHVHPGRAARAYERVLRLSRAQNAREATTNLKMPPQPPNPDRLRIGQTILARDLTWEWVTRRHILERDPETDLVRPGPNWERAVEGYRKAALKKNGQG